MAWLVDPGIRANVAGIAVNTGLMVAKFIVGYLAASDALTADGFNSAGDIFATAIAFFGYVYARKPPDEDHHYGHGNAESIAGLVIGSVLFATGLFIAIQGVIALAHGKTNAPEAVALWVAGGTAVVKEALYHYTTRVGKALNSPSLLASARDHRADVLVALTVLAAIIGARIGAPWLDPLAAVVVGLYISWFAVMPINANISVLMDQAPPGLREQIHRTATAVAEVREADHIRIHPLGSYFMVDLEIYVDGGRSLHEAREIAHRVADRVRAEVDNVRDVKVHVNPTGLPAE